MNQLIRIGQMAAAHGVEGQLILKHNLGKKTDFEGTDAFLIEQSDGRMLPYFPAEVKARSAEESLVRLEGIQTREKALTLLKKGVWLEAAMAQKLAAKNAPIALLGFDVWNEGTLLGPVLEVIEQPGQVLLRLEMEGKEVLLPVHEDTLEAIDHKKRVIRLVLPDGLLDIYLK
jgi:16S rRNA processing protein RimM